MRTRSGTTGMPVMAARVVGATAGTGIAPYGCEPLDLVGAGVGLGAGAGGWVGGASVGAGTGWAAAPPPVGCAAWVLPEPAEADGLAPAGAGVVPADVVPAADGDALALGAPAAVWPADDRDDADVVAT